MSEADQIEVTCPRCQKHLRVRRDQAGTKVKCSNPSCTMQIDIPLSNQANEVIVTRYPALRLVAFLYWILSILTLLGGVGLGIVRAFMNGPAGADLLGGGLALAGSLVGCVTCLAVAESIKLAIDIEDHARVIRTSLTRTTPPGPTEKS